MASQSTIHLLLLAAILLTKSGLSFQLAARPSITSFSTTRTTSSGPVIGTARYLSIDNKETDVKFSRDTPESTVNLDNDGTRKERTLPDKAVTNTVNERLMAELKAQEKEEKYGARSSIGKKLRLVDGYGRPRKSDAEIRAAIEAARDLNGVNPAVALTGSFFALGVAAALWYATGKLAAFFTFHPVTTDIYFVQRSAQVVRNVSMGLVSLASGFFGVTGLGIFLLGIRVAYGVITGELDPTPIKRNQVTTDKVDMKNMLDLMTNKKPGRRGGRGGSDNDNNSNMFGL
ncbi:unnamed protein product [Cylindrotheca closterium]|uniref:PRA1 family protein n=1 Tax=Cylindrotheca closterium TaxID=2856 RepID=A0AAD2JLQ4_9STRA|nr:unnamed protein product [Cylindrotheca closterium]